MTGIAATSTRTPKLGDVWMSRDRRDQGRTIKVVGISETSVIVRSVSVRRVRMDVFIAGYRFVRHAPRGGSPVRTQRRATAPRFSPADPR